MVQPPVGSKWQYVRISGARYYVLDDVLYFTIFDNPNGADIQITPKSDVKIEAVAFNWNKYGYMNVSSPVIQTVPAGQTISFNLPSVEKVSSSYNPQIIVWKMRFVYPGSSTEPLGIIDRLLSLVIEPRFPDYRSVKQGRGFEKVESGITPAQKGIGRKYIRRRTA